MPTRREVLLAAGMALSGQLLPRVARSQSYPVHDALGCVLQRPLEELSSHLYGIASLRQGLIATTGDPAMDRALGRALVRLSTIFGEQPGFGFIDDGGAPNAYASPQTQVQGTWGTAMFGQTMFHDLLDPYTDQGMAVLAVCAHEFGHIAQFRAGVRDRLLRGQRTVKRMELHADLLSGYFLGYRKRIDGDISVWAAGHALYSIGDYAFNNPNHHGTPDERVAAAEYGYKLAYDERVSYRDAFRRGVDHIIARF
jgi:hypothetical protein